MGKGTDNMKGKLRRYSKASALWGMFLPSALGVMFLYILPFLLTLNSSFRSRTGGKTEYGFSHYADILGNPVFRLGVKNFFRFALLVIPLVCVVSLALALALKRWEPGSGFLFSMLLPFVVPSGSTAFFWNTIFSLNGWLNRLRFQCGLEPVMWDSGRWSIFIPVILYLWKFCGFFALVFYAGLRQIPDEYYEIARIEGAGRRTVFFRITLAYLSPVVMIVLLLAFIGSFQISRELFMLFGRYPYSDLYLFQHFLNNHLDRMNLPVLCSASVLLILVVCSVVMPVWLVQKRLSDTFEKRGEFNLFSPRNRSGKGRVRRILTAALALLFLLPVLFTISNSLMSPVEVTRRYSAEILEQNGLSRGGLHFMEPTLLPWPLTISQYKDFLLNPVYLRMFWNSVLLAALIAAGHIVVSVLGAFVFFRVKKRYMTILFMAYILLMVIPAQVLLTPQFVFFQTLRLEGSYWAIILPAVFNPVGVFIVSLQMRGFPQECIEAAQLGGAGELCILRRVVLPNIKGAVLVLTLYIFAEYWNIVDQAVVFLSNQNRLPLSVFLSDMLQGDMGLVSAGSVVYLIPICLVFAACLLGLREERSQSKTNTGSEEIK